MFLAPITHSSVAYTIVYAKLSLYGISENTLMDRYGNVVQRFEPAVTPDSKDVTGAIEKQQKQ